MTLLGDDPLNVTIDLRDFMKRFHALEDHYPVKGSAKGPSFPADYPRAVNCHQIDHLTLVICGKYLVRVTDGEPYRVGSDMAFETHILEPGQFFFVAGNRYHEFTVIEGPALSCCLFGTRDLETIKEYT